MPDPDDDRDGLVGDRADGVVDHPGALVGRARVDQHHTLRGDDHAEVGVVAEVARIAVGGRTDQREDALGELHGLQNRFGERRAAGQQAGQDHERGQADAKPCGPAGVVGGGRIHSNKRLCVSRW